MNKIYLAITTALGSLMSQVAIAHGDHAHVNPEHGLEHALYYGLGFIAVMLIVGRVRKAKRRHGKQV